jgi:hypothetical protein
LDQGCRITLDVKANLVSQVRFVLACTTEQAKQIANNLAESSRRFAVVATVDAVHSGQQLAEGDGHSAPQEFALAEGRCLELIYVATL